MTCLLHGAIACTAAISTAAIAGGPCGEWTVVDNPIFQGAETYPIHIESLGLDSAVGARMSNSGLLRMHWDGDAWTVVAADMLDFSNSWEVRALHANALDDLWVAGIVVVQTFQAVPFIAHFDGQDWESHQGFLFEIPNPNGGSPLRNGEGSEVVYFAPDDVWVVGAGESPGGGVSCPIALHWDGSELRESSPQIQPIFNRMNRFDGADGVASDDLWVVGEGRNLTENFRASIHHWNGASWTPHPNWTQLPGSNSLQDGLDDVVALASDDVWAVGKKLILENGQTRSVSLYLHWNGSEWREVVGPDIGPLTSVAAISADDIWASCAFGEYGGRLAHWDGESWAEVQSAPRPGATHIGLTNLAAGAAGEAWAIGYSAIYDGQGGWEVYENIIEHLTPNCLVFGDLDGDGLVNFADLNLLLGSFNAVGENMPGDLDDDGDIDFADLNLLLGVYNQGA